MVLTEIIHAMGKRGEIDIYAEMGFHDNRPDFWIIRCNGLPVGFIKIKKPSPTIMNDPIMAGQVFDYIYLTLLKSFYGIELQFGIVSTYVDWRFFWLSGTDAAAKQSSIHNLQSITNSDQSPLIAELPGIPCFGKDVKPLEINIIQPSDTPQTSNTREVYASKVFSIADNDILLAIASIFSKMITSPRRKINLADSSRPYIQMTQNSWHWVSLPDILAIKFAKIPRSNVKNYICLAYLGSGAEGLVWLATTTGGTGFVIKLARSVKPTLYGNENLPLTGRNTEFVEAHNHLMTEANNWNALWGIDTHVKMIGGQPALIMPYFKLCTDNELENDNEIKTADQTHGQ